jgi:hypothetical protein
MFKPLRFYRRYSQKPSLNFSPETIKSDRQSYLSSSALKYSKYLFKARFSPVGSAKNIVLASPHPGSGLLMKDFISLIASQTQASVLHLNYQTFLHLYSHYKPSLENPSLMNECT